MQSHVCIVNCLCKDANARGYDKKMLCCKNNEGGSTFAATQCKAMAIRWTSLIIFHLLTSTSNNTPPPTQRTIFGLNVYE